MSRDNDVGKARRRSPKQEPRTRSDRSKVSIVEENLDAIGGLYREYGVTRLEILGSATTAAFDPDTSDADVLVEHPSDHDFGLWLSRSFELKERLKTMLGRPVDLVIVDAPRNPCVIRSINETRRLVSSA